MGDDNREILCTSNDEMDSLQAGDSTVVITGAVVELDPPRRRQGASAPRVRIFRFILSNLEGRRIRVLVWGDRVPEFENTVYRQMVTIHRPQVVPANPLYVEPERNLMSMELSIRPTTTIEIHGPIRVEPVLEPQYREITLANAGRFIGLVQITAYIRHRIERQVYSAGIYGSGAITDGRYHLCVNVTVFDANMSPEVGQHVTIVGELRLNRHNTLILQVQNMQNIRVIDDERMDALSLRAGFRPPPRDAEVVEEQQPAQPNEGNPQAARNQVIEEGRLEAEVGGAAAAAVQVVENDVVVEHQDSDLRVEEVALHLERADVQSSQPAASPSAPGTSGTSDCQKNSSDATGDGKKGRKGRKAAAEAKGATKVKKSRIIVEDQGHLPPPSTAGQESSSDDDDVDD